MMKKKIIKQKQNTADTHTWKVGIGIIIQKTHTRMCRKKRSSFRQYFFKKILLLFFIYFILIYALRFLKLVLVMFFYAYWIQKA
jgi:hypothetical protein